VYNTQSGTSVDDADGVTQERNVILHKGWFDNSVPPFLAGLPKGENGEPLPVALVHMDCNLYTSTSAVRSCAPLLASRGQLPLSFHSHSILPDGVSSGQVLGFLRPHLVSGTVIWFDDFLMVDGWQLNENKAWNEFVDAHDIRFEWVAFGYMAAVVRVL
jgi:hypothetical protein